MSAVSMNSINHVTSDKEENLPSNSFGRTSTKYIFYTYLLIKNSIFFVTDGQNQPQCKKISLNYFEDNFKLN